MLVARSMGSHGGQQNFPFGYIPTELHGIGLPEFMTPGPPPGQPLLSEHDTQNLDSFLNGFDAGVDQNKDALIQQYQNSMETNHEWMMPPTFVGSETSLRPRNGADWQSFQMSDFTFGNDINMAGMNHASDFQHGLHNQNFSSNGHYDHNLLSQLHSAAQSVQPSFAPGWQPNFQPHHVPQMQQPPRPIVRYGSDSHFQPHGYAPPEGSFDPTGTPSLDWLEAQSSAANTQPNTEPNTQPSSPNWSKKRKLDDLQIDIRRNGYGSSVNGHSTRTQPPTPNSAYPIKRTYTNHEQPPTPRFRTQAKQQLVDEDAVDDEDADYDEDDEPEPRNKSDSPSTVSRSKPSKSSTKPARARKKSTASANTNKSKPKAARNSISGTSTARVPLTADQKKANHTNSEQRRRDATARSYAELYDLVPELEELGKQSTMKKLEIVVNKVQKVKDRVLQLRTALGLDSETGMQAQHNTGHAHGAAGSARALGGNLASDISSWH